MTVFLVKRVRLSSVNFYKLMLKYVFPKHSSNILASSRLPCWWTYTRCPFVEFYLHLKEVIGDCLHLKDAIGVCLHLKDLIGDCLHLKDLIGIPYLFVVQGLDRVVWV